MSANVLLCHNKTCQSYLAELSHDSVTVVYIWIAELQDCDVANPCLNNGTCVVQSDVIACVCTQNYTGEYCDVSVAVMDPDGRWSDGSSGFNLHILQRVVKIVKALEPICVVSVERLCYTQNVAFDAFGGNNCF